MMGIENIKSQRFINKVDVAKKYMATLDSNASKEKVQESLKDLLEDFDGDPVFQAKLEMERLSKLGKK